MAAFLKKVFPSILGNVETETIKRHLKDDEQRGIIQIQEKPFRRISTNKNHYSPVFLKCFFCVFTTQEKHWLYLLHND